MYGSWGEPHHKFLNVSLLNGTAQRGSRGGPIRDFGVALQEDKKPFDDHYAFSPNLA
jgi:hypothetical protein